MHRRGRGNCALLIVVAGRLTDSPPPPYIPHPDTPERALGGASATAACGGPPDTARVARSRLGHNEGGRRRRGG